MVNRLDKKEAVMDAQSVSPKSTDGDLNYELNPRPQTFDEYIGSLADDPDVKAIASYIEGFKNGPAYLAAARKVTATLTSRRL